MNTKHTPGPWRVSQHDQLMFGAQVDETFTPLGFVYGPALAEQSPTGRQAISDARLIAAAPDSHEANVKTVEAFNAAFGINETWTDDRIYDELPSSGLAQAYFAARAAVAKATGESA